MEDSKEVCMEDVAKIMNRINEALYDLGFVAVGYDNTDVFLKVLIEKQ